MIKHSASFKEWLSGKFVYSDPPAWILTTTPTHMVLAPAKRPIILSLILFSGFLCFGCLIFWTGRGETDIGVLIVMILIGGSVVVIGLGAGGLMLTVFLINYLKGPYVIFSTTDRNIFLPRDNLTIPRCDELGWRVVSGNWVGPEGAQKQNDYPISELQLIMKDGEDAIACLIVGSQTESMTPQARQIASVTDLSIEIILQHQGVSAAAPSARVKWWRTRAK